MLLSIDWATGQTLVENLKNNYSLELNNYRKTHAFKHAQILYLKIFTKSPESPKESVTQWHKIRNQ